MAHKGRLNVMLVFALVVVSIQCACAAPWNHAKAAEQHQRLVLWTNHLAIIMTAPRGDKRRRLLVPSIKLFKPRPHSLSGRHFSRQVLWRWICRSRQLMCFRLSRQGALAARDHSPPSRRTLLYSSHNLTSSGLFLIHPEDKT